MSSDGLATPRARAASPAAPPPPPTAGAGKTVQFVDDPPQAHSDSELSMSSFRHGAGRGEPRPRRWRVRAGRRAGSPASEGSDGSDGTSDRTVDLPPRFEADGRPVRGGGGGGGGYSGQRHDSIAEAVEAFMRGRGARGFATVVDEMLGLVPRQGQRRGSRGADRVKDERDGRRDGRRGTSRGWHSDEYD